MRIVGGFLKGKKIDFLKSKTTRPLRDFVKENIFNVINHSNLIQVKLENSNVLDVYSGTGSFGIECISRGANRTTFIENNNTTLTILKNNLNNLKIEEKSDVYSEKTNLFFKRSGNENKFEIIFFDPPFAENFFIDELKMIKNSQIYKKKNLIIIHREATSNDEIFKTINILLTKSYGRSKVIFGTL
jgi:16S rRNA (guanine966-N2)-methyltransferase